MRDHDRFRLFRVCLLQLRHIDIVLRDRHIDKYRYGAILKNRRHRRRESAGDRDHFVSLPDLSLSELRCGQRHESDQVRGGSAVDQVRKPYTDPFREFLLKLIRKPPRRQPEIQHRVGQALHLLLIENSRCVADPVPWLKRALLLFKLVVILTDHLPDLLPCFRFIFPHGNSCSSSVFISSQMLVFNIFFRRFHSVCCVIIFKCLFPDISHLLQRFSSLVISDIQIRSMWLLTFCPFQRFPAARCRSLRSRTSPQAPPAMR